MNVCICVSIWILCAYVYLSDMNKFMNLPDKFSKLRLEFLGLALYLITKMLRTVSSSEGNNAIL